MVASTIDLLRAGDRGAAVTIVAGGSGKAVMDDLRRDVAEMEAVETALLASRERETDASYRAPSCRWCWRRSSVSC